MSAFERTFISYRIISYRIVDVGSVVVLGSWSWYRQWRSSSCKNGLAYITGGDFQRGEQKVGRGGKGPVTGGDRRGTAAATVSVDRRLDGGRAASDS